ncbi:hypothetical protein BP00DRAFT_425818 [Aspergillus indologenus CBS 114.80]|uniref:Uncharacterized protein n=1 Tax=Aspergillus indologenus CBS 114.80 TaxID=1450541 RepID=A0A2V5I326_9EURO|nr:hypothetical protein BP00DRAFT_425818 [Aspergillus indologenus CBS 114.80]
MTAEGVSSPAHLKYHREQAAWPPGNPDSLALVVLRTDWWFQDSPCQGGRWRNSTTSVSQVVEAMVGTWQGRRCV